MNAWSISLPRLSRNGATALLAIVAVVLMQPAQAQTDTQPIADTVYRNGFVYTVDGSLSRAQAFAVKDGKFIAVGSDDDMKPYTGDDTDVINLRGKMAMEKEDETGTIEAGKSADFIVLDRNLLEIPANKIHETKVLRTVLQGKTVYKN